MINQLSNLWFSSRWAISFSLSEYFFHHWQTQSNDWSVTTFNCYVKSTRFSAELEGDVSISVIPVIDMQEQLHPPTPTHTHIQTKAAGQQKQTPLEQGLFILERGHKETVWPQHFKPSEAINYKVSGCKGLLMCIDSYCTKRQKQSLAVLSGWIPLQKYLDNMHPCDSWKNNGPICVYSPGKCTVCVKSTLTNDIVLQGN